MQAFLWTARNAPGLFFDIVNDGDPGPGEVSPLGGATMFRYLLSAQAPANGMFPAHAGMNRRRRHTSPRL